MESSSTLYMSPSFNSHSSNNIANIANRVVQELLSENSFSFSDDDNQAFINDDVNSNPHSETVNQITENSSDEDEQEFEFPVMCGDANSCHVSSDSVSDDQISLRYPLFDRSLLSDVDMNFCNGVDTTKTESKQPVFDRNLLSDVDLSFRNGVDSPMTECKPPANRSSLLKLFDESRETTSFSSSSSSETEADELDGIIPGTYCVWKPKTDTDPDSDPKPDLKSNLRGKHKKSNSLSIGNTSNRWKVLDILKRSYSDDDYSTGKDSQVLLFIPPISPNQKNSEKVNRIGKAGAVMSTRVERNIPAYKSTIGTFCIPYREDQFGAYANFTGLNKNTYRC